jgi:hypothetical protein
MKPIVTLRLEQVGTSSGPYLIKGRSQMWIKDVPRCSQTRAAWRHWLPSLEGRRLPAAGLRRWFNRALQA